MPGPIARGCRLAGEPQRIEQLRCSYHGLSVKYAECFTWTSRGVLARSTS